MVAQSLFIGYCEIMLENIKIYTSDICWNHILTDLGAVLVDNPNIADVVLDDIDIKAPISVVDLQKIILDCLNNQDIIKDVFGDNDIVLPTLQHKIVVLLYKNPGITMNELKNALGVMPGVTTHAVETAVYQLRKKYGHDFIQNTNGKYKIGRI